MQLTRAVENGLICGIAGRLALEEMPSPCGVARSFEGIELIDTVGLIGLNYRSAGLDVRSRAALTDDRMASFLEALRRLGVPEGVVISTCNRTEIYYAGSMEEEVADLFASYASLSREEIRRHLYLKHGICAICHLFQVAAGLDSAVLGETEIVSQVKQGWTAAAEAQTTGPTLDLVFKRALEASKRIRTETDLCRNSTSVGSLAVREAESRTGDLSRKRVLVLGSGQIAERVGKELRAAGAHDVVFLNRSPERAQLLAERLGFDWGPLSRVEETMHDVDVLFATTSAPHPILSQAEIEGLMATRRGRPLIAVDLGVPNNVDPGAVVSGLELVNMDTLVSKCVMNHERRTAAIPQALTILHEELERVRVKLTERQAAGTIKALFDHGDAVKDRTLEWAFGKLKNLDEQEKRVIEDLARRLVLGVLTPPIEELKSGAVSLTERQAIERIFRTNEGERDRS